jgi:uncharacterized integral membrane protein (TIGR00697 family)
MINELLFFGEILTGFLLIILAYKLFGKTGLFVWTTIAVILANIQVYKTIRIFGLVTALGNAIYASTFLVTDILTEKYSEKEAQKAVWIGFYTLIATTIVMQLTLYFIPDASDILSPHLEALFRLFPRIALASITAYLISQFHDVWLFMRLRKRTGGKHLWLRNNVATILSQFLDNTVFTLIAFTGIMSWQVMWEIWLTSMILKVIIAFCDTPFVYWAGSMRKTDVLGTGQKD